MSYHDLSECTLNPDERREEAGRICKMLDDREQMTEKEQNFLAEMDFADWVSVKQLFWLRDIKDKY